MKKLSLLLGTLGGATAGYLFSNTKLRDRLSKAKDAEEAAKILGEHLQKDGKKLAKQFKDFVDSEDVKQNITKAKKFARSKMESAKRELDEMTSDGKKAVKKTVKKGATKAKKTAKRTVTKAKGVAKKSAKKARSKAKKTVKRMKTTVRKVGR